MKKFLFALGIILLILLIGFLIAEPILENRIAKFIKSNDSKLKVEYQEIDVSIIPLSCKILDFKVNSSKLGLNVSGNELKLKSFQLFDLIFNDVLEVEELIIKAHTVKKYLIENSDKGSKDTSSNKSSKYKRVGIEQLSVTFDNIILYNADSTQKMSSKNLELNSIGMSYELGANHPEPIDFQSIELKLDSIVYNSIKHHLLKTDQLTFSSDSTFGLKNLKLIPQRKETKYRVNYNDLWIEEISFNANWSQVVNHQEMSLSELNLTNFNFKSYLDKTQTVAPNHTPQLLHEMIQSLGFPLSIDQLNLKNGQIRYEELSSKSPEPGIVKFKDFNATIKHLSNQESYYKDSIEQMTAAVNFKLMDEAEVEVDISYDLLSENGQHQLKGELHNMAFEHLNPAFQPLVSIKFQEGYVNDLFFDIFIKGNQSSGDVRFLYKDLEIAINENEETTSFFNQILGDIASFAANSFVIRKNNPEDGETLVADVQFTRDPNKSFLNFWWKSLFSGMQNTMMKTKGDS